MADAAHHIEVIGLAAQAAGNFGQQALAWNAFFSSVAQVSGGLVGLVFVALTFNGRLGRDGDSRLRDLARQTFADFLNVLVVSLIFLVPSQSSDNVAVFMMICGSLGVFRILRTLLQMWRRPHALSAPVNLLQRFLLSLLGNVGLLVAGAISFEPEFNASAFWSTVLGSVVGLLVSGSRSAWTLVVPENAKATPQD